MDESPPKQSFQSESSARPKTYFYVFVEKIRTLSVIRHMEAATPASAVSTAGGEPENLDSVVFAAFERFRKAYPDEAKVYVNQEPYNDLRQLFGIKELPAFGISDIELAGLVQQRKAASKPPNLPPWYNPFTLGKRRAALESGKYLPKIERAVIKKYEKQENVFDFLRDLHLANIDAGLGGVNSKIEQEIRAIGGAKLLKVVGAARKVFIG
jgi:hypothetical protein